MIRIWDGFLSFLAALLTAGVTGVPIWTAHLAIDAGLMTPLAYAALAGLLFLGLVMVNAFLQKAFRGVGPLRERRR